MSAIERLPVTQWASIHRTEKFVSVEPLSGYRRSLRENALYVIYLPQDPSDETLGRALLEAFDRSRFIWPDDEREFFKWQRYVECDRKWEEEFMRRYGYKTKRDAYANMNWCRAQRSQGKISIQPHDRREQPGAWRNLPPEDTVVIPATENAATVGAALRLALDRCG